MPLNYNNNYEIVIIVQNIYLNKIKIKQLSIMSPLDNCVMKCTHLYHNEGNKNQVHFIISIRRLQTKCKA